MKRHVCPGRAGATKVVGNRPSQRIARSFVDYALKAAGVEHCLGEALTDLPWGDTPPVRDSSRRAPEQYVRAAGPLHDVKGDAIDPGRGIPLTPAQGLACFVSLTGARWNLGVRDAAARHCVIVRLPPPRFSSMSAFTRPFLVDPSGGAVLLDRIPLTAGGDGQLSERWLQEALFAHPDSLPVREIDPHIGQLIPVCMEIETGSGPADILYVTPTGQVVLLETKLWRNPEARREVVGQILDYAKQLTTWTYEVLEQKAAMAARAEGRFLLDCLRKHSPQADPTAFVDGVGKSLSTGDFLLLIVGDGIRYGAEALVVFLERFGNLKFGFGLVEVAAYRLPSGQTLLQPRILAKTETLERTVLVGPSGPLTFQQAAQAEDAVLPDTSQREWFRAFWSEFIKKLKLEDRALMPTEPAKSTNQFFAMPPGGGMAWISAYIAQSSSRGGVYLTFAKAFDRAAEVYESLESDREAIERDVGFKLSWENNGDKFYVGSPKVPFADLNAPAERDRVTGRLADMTERMIRVLKPRLAAMSQRSS